MAHCDKADSSGRGRGRQVVSVAKTADVIILMSEVHKLPQSLLGRPQLIQSVDATKSAEQKKMLEIELDAVGIRLNARPPDVVFKQKTAGGVSSHFHIG